MLLHSYSLQLLLLLLCWRDMPWCCMVAYHACHTIALMLLLWPHPLLKHHTMLLLLLWLLLLLQQQDRCSKERQHLHTTAHHMLTMTLLPHLKLLQLLLLQLLLLLLQLLLILLLQLLLVLIHLAN